MARIVVTPWGEREIASPCFHGSITLRAAEEFARRLLILVAEARAQQAADWPVSNRKATMTTWLDGESRDPSEED